ncbi:hypothetical protein TI39_contig4419g00004 [Zymoseptoria brevis]|uniref:Uncharacterized protein n=1 Tax=Zymoseptoria brevis TaxID=1047168 RepID=A0A0F4G7U2_9PEZI|nr:hypothetical protein TI39_contig4419g00004 [Zymoseptoria brevis]
MSGKLAPAASVQIFMVGNKAYLDGPALSLDETGLSGVRSLLCQDIELNPVSCGILPRAIKAGDAAGHDMRTPSPVSEGRFTSVVQRDSLITSILGVEDVSLQGSNYRIVLPSRSNGTLGIDVATDILIPRKSWNTMASYSAPQFI